MTEYIKDIENIFILITSSKFTGGINFGIRNERPRRRAK